MAFKKKIHKIAFLFLFFSFFPIISYGANLSISPSSATFEVGDRVTIKVLVSSSSPINAISGTVFFPTDLFTVESVSKAGSILNFWVSEPSFSKGVGLLQFEGVTLGGYGGGTGTVVTARLKAIKEGQGTVVFKNGKVLANDGQGTDVTSNLEIANYSIIPKKKIDTPVQYIPEKEEETISTIEDLPQVPATLSSPEIEMSHKFGEQAIYGTSKYSNAEVLTTFVAKNGVKIFITGETDQNGEFTMLVPKTLKRGVYNVSSIVVLVDTNHTYPSNEIEIKVGNFFSDISLEIKISILALLIILIYLIIRSTFYLKKNKKLRSFVHQEAHKAEDTIHKSFKVLNEDIDDVILKKLSVGEREYIKNLKKDLKEAEEVVSKEIKDIEKS